MTWAIKDFPFLFSYKVLDWTGRVFWVTVPNESGGVFLNIGRQDGFVPFLIHSATVFISKVERVCSRDMTPSTPCFTDEAVCLGSLAAPFFSIFVLSHHTDKGSSLSHRSINTVPKLFWLTFVLTNIYIYCYAFGRCFYPSGLYFIQSWHFISSSTRTLCWCMLGDPHVATTVEWMESNSE